MEATTPKAKCNPYKGAFYFLTFTVLTAAVVMVTIVEGNRIKKENELLAYEVWWLPDLFLYKELFLKNNNLYSTLRLA